MKITRDGALLWLLALVALVGYLLTVGKPPTDWSYREWLTFLSWLAGWGVGKLQVSPQPSSNEVRRGIRDNGEPV